MLRRTIVLHYPVSILGNILCIDSSKRQQSNLSPICPQKNSPRPGLYSLTSLWVCKYGRLLMGINKAVILFSLPLRAAPRLSGVDGNTHTSVHKLWFRTFYIQRAQLILERSKSHPSTPSFLTACCIDLMQQKLYTETSFSTDDSKVCKFSKVSSNDMEIE